MQVNVLLFYKYLSISFFVRNPVISYLIKRFTVDGISCEFGKQSVSEREINKLCMRKEYSWFVVFQALTLELKGESGSSSTADSTKLTLTLLKHSLVLNGEAEVENESIDFLSRWMEGMSLAFGGVPGKATGKTPTFTGIYIYMIYQCQFMLRFLQSFAFLSTLELLTPFVTNEQVEK